jgi:hypothetical protein
MRIGLLMALKNKKAARLGGLGVSEIMPEGERIAVYFFNFHGAR